VRDQRLSKPTPEQREAGTKSERAAAAFSRSLLETIGTWAPTMRKQSAHLVELDSLD
jgi:hypothetical protein